MATEVSAITADGGKEIDPQEEHDRIVAEQSARDALAAASDALDTKTEASVTEDAVTIPGFTLIPSTADISDATQAVGEWIDKFGGGSGAISAGRGFILEQTEEARSAAASAILKGTGENMDRDAAVRALGPAAALSGDLGMAKLVAAAYGAPVEDMGGWAGCGKFAVGRGFFIDWRLADPEAVANACRAAGLRAFAPEG